jgi:(p)ppGpp synthase/HD superfamily hydrolase
MITQRTRDMQRLMDALDLCRKCHIHQTDKCGQPYWIHPFTVAMRSFSGYGNIESISYAIIGLLHDIPEDTRLSVDDIATLIELTEDEIAALKLLIHTKNMPYDEYIDSIIESSNDIAITVKLEDLLHNMNLNRFTEANLPISDKDEARHNKYRKALDKLLAKINED